MTRSVDGQRGHGPQVENHWSVSCLACDIWSFLNQFQLIIFFSSFWGTFPCFSVILYFLHKRISTILNVFSDLWTFLAFSGGTQLLWNSLRFGNFVFKLGCAEPGLHYFMASLWSHGYSTWYNWCDGFPVWVIRTEVILLHLMQAPTNVSSGPLGDQSFSSLDFRGSLSRCLEQHSGNNNEDWLDQACPCPASLEILAIIFYSTSQYLQF